MHGPPWTREGREVLHRTLTLAPDPRSAASARRFLDRVLEEAHCDDAEGTVILLANELVTNAILHASSELDLVVELDEDVIRVEVHDGSERPPVRRHMPTESTSGRGLDLVQALASAWGVEWMPDDGKAVWFEVRRSR